MIITLTLILLIIKFVKKLSIHTFRKQIAVTVVVIIYSLHPTLTRVSSSLYFCMQLDEGEYWLQADLEIKCWTGPHLSWCLGLGLISILVWTIGSPILTFIHIRKNRQKLQTDEFFGKYRMLYQGLKKECYYWEFANILRKTFLVCINVFLNLYSNTFKALLSLIVLTGFKRIQKNLKPYKNPLFNNLEEREMMIQIITFFGALFFISDEISDSIQLVVFIIIVLANGWFIALCIYCIVTNVKYHFFQRVSQILAPFVLSKILQEDEEIYRQSTRGDQSFQEIDFNKNKNKQADNYTSSVLDSRAYSQCSNQKSQKMRQCKARANSIYYNNEQKINISAKVRKTIFTKSNSHLYEDTSIFKTDKSTIAKRNSKNIQKFGKSQKPENSLQIKKLQTTDKSSITATLMLGNESVQSESARKHLQENKKMNSFISVQSNLKSIMKKVNSPSKKTLLQLQHNNDTLEDEKKYQDQYLQKESKKENNCKKIIISDNQVKKQIDKNKYKSSMSQQEVLRQQNYEKVKEISKSIGCTSDHAQVNSFMIHLFKSQQEENKSEDENLKTDDAQFVDMKLNHGLKRTIPVQIDIIDQEKFQNDEIFSDKS
ncbi:UNKNOWN [Stylonychia lemnae]|uniref:Transmembrane protein n=1 Tax=Stylonychia lemnae TaxID=5949 RepID=A0A078A300_STYLE|nr:UNKNOWN [Stylonychia lemnae]|eukprot:CDW76658.1 UNKNOWN [Stylonychia lemnae]